MRSFDPVRLGLYEADAWVAYYRRRWPAFLIAAFGMVRNRIRLRMDYECTRGVACAPGEPVLGIVPG